MKPSSSTSSSKYRVHSPSDTVPHSHSARSRGSISRHIGDPRDQQVTTYSPSSTPVTGFDLYDARGYPVQPYIEHHHPSSYPGHQSYPPPPPPAHQHPSYPSSHPQPYPPQHHPVYGSYESQPAPPTHIHPHHQSYSSSQSLTPYSSGHSQQPQSSRSRQHSQSDLSQYSLSQYKPRYRIEQEGRNLVVLPSGDTSSSSLSPSLSPSPSPSPSPTPVLTLPPPAAPPRAIRAAPRQWPPVPYQTELTPVEAKEFISDGAPKFRGELREISNGPRGHYHLFAFGGDEWDEETDTAVFQSDSFCDMSSSPEGKQTDALERPAMAHAFGIYPGTLTLAYYVSSFSSTFRGNEIAARGKIRKLAMLYVLDRLRVLQVNGIEEDLVQLHRHLYEYLLYDTRRYDYAQIQVSLDNQIADLIAALCRPSWVDFSYPETQTVARFLTDPNPSVANNFLHQLLLSVELYLRINLRSQTNAKPLGDMPEKLRWDLMLAERWLENVEVEAPKKVKDGKGKRNGEKSSVSFKFPHKKNQIEALRNFAWTLKWPNMHEVEYTLSEEEDPNVEDRSINCMSWFTGLLLPGKSMPWIVMNALTDCDPDVPEEFRNLSQASPNVGFQYKGHTYWSWECIVGKVLGAAAGVAQIAGWIGPCSASADLDRSEMAVINQIPPRGNKVTPSDIRSMAQNSDPLGAHQTTYPVDDYVLPIPNTDDPVEDIRIERLNFSPAACNPKGIHAIGRTGEGGSPSQRKPVVVFDASITFAITVEHRARSWKVSLRHDTPFIAAYPCQKGPHVLFCEYQHRIIFADKLVEIPFWGASGGGEDSEPEEGGGSQNNSSGVEEVLVVEAFGVPDNEVFARAWCSFWGLPAITADINKTCMACAVREAYAALVSVVILTNRSSVDVEVEEVDRLMENL